MGACGEGWCDDEWPLSTFWDLKSPGRCLWGIILIKLIEVGRPDHCQVGSSVLSQQLKTVTEAAGSIVYILGSYLSLSRLKALTTVTPSGLPRVPERC